MADPVVEVVTQDRCTDEDEEQDPWVEKADGRKGPRGEDEAIARKVWKDDKACFAKDYREQNKVCPASKLLDEVFEPVTDVKYEIQYVCERYHEAFFLGVSFGCL